MGDLLPYHESSRRFGANVRLAAELRSTGLCCGMPPVASVELFFAVLGTTRARFPFLQQYVLLYDARPRHCGLRGLR